MSSWRFGDVQHSLSLSCDFILRLPLSGVCLRSEVFFPQKCGWCHRVHLQVEQVRLNPGAAGLCAVQWDTVFRFDDFSGPEVDDNDDDDDKKQPGNCSPQLTQWMTVETPLFFHPPHALFCQFNDQSEQDLELEAVVGWISTLFRLQPVKQVPGAASLLGCRTAKRKHRNYTSVSARGARTFSNVIQSLCVMWQTQLELLQTLTTQMCLLKVCRCVPAGSCRSCQETTTVSGTWHDFSPIIHFF